MLNEPHQVPRRLARLTLFRGVALVFVTGTVQLAIGGGANHAISARGPRRPLGVKTLTL